MRIVYLGKIQLSDVDLSYLHEAQQLADVTYVLEVNPRFMQGPAFNLKKLYPKSGLFKATEIYPEFSSLSKFIDLDKCYVLNTTGKLWILKSFWTYFILLKFLIRQKFTVIHLVWPPNIYEFILYVLRKRMILTVHDPINHAGFEKGIIRLRRVVAFKLIPQFIILNKAQKQEFIDYYRIASKRVLVSRLSCYTYLNIVEPQQTNIPAKDSYILFVGRISTYKGLDFLLPAMEKVHAIHPECKLVVAGKGQFHFDISTYKKLEYIDIRNRFISDGELVALIKNCAFMVCPYTNATQSGVIMSAYAFNKPVLATDVGGLPEMVRHEHYGIIVKHQDIDMLAEGIIRLWKTPGIVSAFTKEIERDYKTGQLSWRKAAEEMVDVYKQYI